MEEIIYLNGELVHGSKAGISPFDHGFLYGYGLYETFRSYNGIIFRLDRHLRRLKKSAEVLGLDSKLAAFDLEKDGSDLLRINQLKDARIRITISAGTGGIIPGLQTCDQPTVCMVARKLSLIPPEVYQCGYKVLISSYRRNSRSPLSQIKSTSCLENVLALQEAKAKGVDDALLLNEKGMLAEGGTSNIFLVKDGALITPTIESGALPGITREAVWELARSLGIEAEKREVPSIEITEADEVFRTSSILEIMPITSIDGKPVGNGKPGLITQKIMFAYSELVSKETCC